MTNKLTCDKTHYIVKNLTHNSGGHKDTTQNLFFKKSSPHIPPACTASRKGSDHFESYVHLLSYSDQNNLF
jgi:hypothetical protein